MFAYSPAFTYRSLVLIGIQYSGIYLHNELYIDGSVHTTRVIGSYCVITVFIINCYRRRRKQTGATSVYVGFQ